MPFRARLKELLTTKKKTQRSRETSRSKSGTTTPQIVEEARPPTEIEEPLETQLLAQDVLNKEEDAKKSTSSIHDCEDAQDRDVDKRLITIDVVIDIASILKESSEASSTLTPLKITCTVILAILQVARDNVMEDINRKALVMILENHYRFAEVERREVEVQGESSPEDTMLVDALESYLKRLDIARAEVASWKEETRPVGSLVSENKRVAAMKQIEEELNVVFTEFMRQVHLSILQSAIKTSGDTARFGVSLMMKEAINARGDRVKPLTPGTRISIIHRLSSWGELKDSPEQIFWLHDKAGTGKSVVAAHMAQKWHKEGVLAGRFFFDRNGGREYRTLRRFPVTLAKEMSDTHPLANASFLETFAKSTRDYNQSFTQEFMQLVISVAEKLTRRTPKALIFVIDALDECVADEVQTLISAILDTLPKAQGVRFLLTSRPTKEITAILDGLSIVAGKGVVLLDVKNGDTQRDHDTTIYVRHTLRDFSTADQNVVIKCARGVFLWATLACDTLLRTITPKKVLLKFEKNTPDRTMETLYETALEAALPQDSSPHDLKLLHSVLQGVGLTYAPVSIIAIRSFFPKHENETVEGEEFVEFYVKKLGSLMKDGTPYLPIYILHPTFREFMEDQKSGAKFYISPPDGHLSIAMAALELLRSSLVPNVLKLDDGKSPVPTMMMPDWEPPARLSLDKEAPLRYAVAYWATHASLAVGEDESLQIMASEFLSTKFIVWIEWASAIKELSESIDGLRRLRGAVRVQNTSEMNTLMDRWCTDALHFLLRYSYPIERCGLQAWTSALVFTPKKSLVYQAFSEKSIRPIPKIITNYAGTSDFSRVLWDNKQAVFFVNMSPDGKRIIAQGRSSFKLFNAKHAKLIADLKGDIAAFSSDGSMIASGSNDTRVYLWDSFTGALKDEWPYGYHTAGVLHVAFVLSDKVIVSIDEDQGILCLSVAHTQWPELRAQEMEGPRHTGLIANIALSPDRKLFATFSSDKATIIWDPQSCKAIGKPMIGTDEVFSGSFSVDGTKIITGHEDGVVAIWEVASQNLIHLLNSGAESNEGIAIHPGGRIVASGDKYLCLWDIETGERVCPPIEEHVSCLTFNETGTRLISGSNKGHVTVWDVRVNGSNVSLQGTTLRGHTLRVNDICSSASGTIISSTSQDGTLRIWDTDLLDASEVEEVVERSHQRVHCIDVSRDGTRLLTAGNEGKFQLWDFTTARRIGEPFDTEEGPARKIKFSSIKTMWASSHRKDTGGTVCIWRYQGEDSSPQTFILRCGQEGVSFFKFGKNDRYLAVGGYDKSLRVWDVAGGFCIATFQCGGFPLHIDMSADGKYLASTFHESPVRVWNLDSHELLGEMDPPHYSSSRVEFLAFSPDGTSLVVQERGTLHLLDVRDGLRNYAVLEQPQDNHSQSSHPAFSEDGRYLFHSNRVVDLSKVSRERRERLQRLSPEKGSSLPIGPRSPLYVEPWHGRIKSERWCNPILLLPSDIRVSQWVAQGSTVAFGTRDGRVFIIKIPEDYM